MKQNDFLYMYRGKRVAPLAEEDVELLSPIQLKREGNERALLLLHGFSSSPAVYRRLLPFLNGYDAIVCPTLPGHGESVEAFSKARASDWVQCVETTCRTLVNDYRAVDVMGLSLGGLLACHLSQQFRLHHLYLLAPALSIFVNIPVTLTLAKVLHALGLRHIPNRAGNLLTEGHPELSYRLLPVSQIIEILTLIRTFKFVPPTCPTDVFLGRFDEVVRSDNVAALFDSLPNTRLHWLERSAHVLPLDGDVDEIIRCLQEGAMVDTP